MLANRALPKLTQRELASLIVLMATARELTNPELKELAGFDLTGKERHTLNSLKLVESRKRGRAYAHELTEDGWLLCRDLFAAERPAGARSFGGALFALLAGLGAGLDRQGLSPAQFFDPRRATHAPAVTPGEADSDSGASSAEAIASVAQSAAAPDPAAVESAIRTVYADLAKTHGGWVGLAPLRAELGAFTRAQVDQALRRLAGEPGVHIIPVANLKSLTQVDRDAALRLGGEDNHALAIETG